MSFKNPHLEKKILPPVVCSLQPEQPLHSSPPPTAALIVAAGSSTRFGDDKLMVAIHGKPLISYSLQAIAETPSISVIILVVPPKREKEFSQMIATLDFPKLSKMTKIVTGGSSRHHSVQRGVAALPPEIRFVAIHDAARPLITPELVNLCLEKAYLHGASSLALPVTDTLHLSDNDGCAKKTIDRKNLWAMQTPQVFRLVDLDHCLKEQLQEKFSPTDEVSALLHHGIKVHLVENREPNIKVTYPEDLALVTALLASR
ncbi:MAG: 2-C-methyl-D-erythritol 4-phosphate cytidylyltransferase [Chthoniobacterales bacterium]